jgi:hypothetical protein
VQTTTCIRSPGAIVLGLLFAIGTAVVLFFDVRSTADLTPDHLMSALVLAGTIAAGHFLLPTLRDGALVPALGLAILFVAGTFYVVTSAAGRNAETASTREAAIAEANRKRADVLAQLDRARSILAAATTQRDAAIQKAAGEAESARKAHADECASGQGKKCDGRALNLEVARKAYSDTAADLTVTLMAEARVRELEAKAATLKPKQLENAQLRHVAKIFALIGGDAERIEAALVLIWPVGKAVVMELAAIVFLGLGLGNKPAQQAPTAPPPLPGKSAPATPPAIPRKGATSRDAAVVAYVSHHRARHGRDPSLPEMLAAFPALSKTSAQRYRRAPADMVPALRVVA